MVEAGGWIIYLQLVDGNSQSKDKEADLDLFGLERA